MSTIKIVKRLPAAGMALYPFILLKREAYKSDKFLINHEKIHLRQQLELLIVFFYLLYALNYLVNLCFYRSRHKAYRQIVFEKEAYNHDSDLNYLKNRPFWNWLRYL